jgi:hypothetical protein
VGNWMRGIGGGGLMEGGGGGKLVERDRWRGINGRRWW